METISVFISYTQSDAAFANQLASQLKSVQVPVWIDAVDLKHLGQGVDEEEAIEEALQQASHVLIVTSAAALNDPFVKDEKQFARDAGKMVVLVKAGPCDLKGKMRWRRIPIADFTSDPDAGMKKLLEILNVTESVPEMKTPVTSPPPESEVPPAPAPVAEPKASSDNGHATLLQELRADIASYRDTLEGQIRGSKKGITILIGCSGALLAGLFFIPELTGLIDEGKSKFEYLSILQPVGGLLPSGLSSISWNKIKKQRALIKSLDGYDRKLSRMERGLIPFTQADLFNIEDEILNLM